LSAARDIRVRDRDAAVAVVRAALAERATLELRGAGSKRGWGRPVDATWTIRLQANAGIVRYEPEELVLSVRPGTSVAELDELLARHAQMLAFEPPDFGPLWGEPAGRATIGGVVACNASGPRRLRAGAVRDHLLGAELVNGRAEIVRAGGRVVKNVTGYDLCKLLAGSFGTLGIITELTLRVVPRARMSVSVAIPGLDCSAATRTMADLMATAAGPSALAYLPSSLGEPVQEGAADSRLVLARFEGSHAGVAERSGSVQQRFGGRVLDAEESAAAWMRLRDVAVFGDASALWRIAIAPAAMDALCALLERGPGCRWFADWGGSLVWVSTEDDGAMTVRDCAAQLDGRAMLFRAAPGTTIDVWPPVQPALAALTRRLRDAFDPASLFNPGRLGA
jgi:glycolate oxidase FAD binding subunit